jgi:hypothetical protein
MFQKIFSLLAIITISLVSSQTIPRTENICFFQNAKSGKPVTIINDSLVYIGELKNPKILKHTDYPGILNDYQYHFNINNRNYLVHAGCGPVLEYRNDSIVRIDNSFMQKNQYGASPFVYNNQICLFGGYGLFTDKNIITQFDFKDKEWFRLFPRGEEEPSTRNDNLNYYDLKGFYAFGGWTRKLIASFERDPSLWFLDYKSLKWRRLGNYNPTIFQIISKSIDKYSAFQTNNKLYLYDVEYILAIDFANNKINYYGNKKLYNVKRLYFDNNSNSLVLLKFFTGLDDLKLETISMSELLKNPVKTEKLYESPWQERVLYIIWISLFLLVSFGVYKWRVYKKRNCFVYYKSKNKLYYKSNVISNLDPMEEKILVYLFQNNKTFLQLNQLNFFFEKENSDNFYNVIKKRDLVFSSLLVKLNAIVTPDKSPLVLIKKNEVDKRIKEIKLNPLYFSLK